jgi:hypothetical protein
VRRRRRTGKSTSTGDAKRSPAEPRPHATTIRRSIEKLRTEADSLPSPSEFDRHVLGEIQDPETLVAGQNLSESDLARLKAENRNLKRLQEVIHFLGAADDLTTLVPEVVGLASSISGLTRGMLALLGSKSRDGECAFKVRVVRGITRAERDAVEVRVLRRILARTLEDRRAAFEADAREIDIAREERESDHLHLGAVVSLPLVVDGELMGALLLDEPTRRTPFTRHEVELLQSYARHAALALARLGDRTRLARKSQRLRTEREELRKNLSETQHELSVLRTRSGRIAAAASSRLGAISDVGSAGGSSVGPPVPAARTQRLDEFLARSFAVAKRSFLKHYLKEAIQRADGDLERASHATGLGVAKLVKLLEIYEVRPTRRFRAASGSFDREGPCAARLPLAEHRARVR